MKHIRNMSITKKMILICLNICMIPLIVGFFVIFKIYVARLNEHTMEFAQAFNAQITANLNHVIQDYEGISKSVLVDNELFFYSEKTQRSVTELVRDNESIQRVLFRITTLQPKVKTVSILMHNGDFIHTGSKGLKINQTAFYEKPWVKGLDQSTENFYVVPAHKADYWNSRTNELVITFVRKIMSSGMKYRGALMIDIDPASVIVLSEEYENAKQKYDIEIRIEDSAGNILYDTRLMDDPTQWQDESMTAPAFGDDYIALEQQSETLGLTVYTAIPKESLNLEEKYVRLMTILVVLLCGVIVVLIVVPISSALTSRLVKVSYGMRQMKNGKYITLPNYESSDELGMLVSSYNYMVHEMEQLIEKVYVAELVKKDSEIAALQNQINPHMLFNTLEVIRMKSLCNGDPVVSKMIFLLAKMFRTMLDSSKKNHRIRDELIYAEEFMRLQNLQSTDQFCFTYDIDALLLDILCIPVLFQPLLENCIEHGRRDKSERLNIKITGKAEGEIAIFQVCDDGRGMDEESLALTRRRLEKARQITDPLLHSEIGGSQNIGLINILRRLRLADERCSDLDILYSNSSGTCIEFRMRIRMCLDEGL